MLDFLLFPTQQQAAAMGMSNLNSAWKVTKYMKLLIAWTSKYSSKEPMVWTQVSWSALWRLPLKTERAIVEQQAAIGKPNFVYTGKLIYGHTNITLPLNLMEMLLSFKKCLFAVHEYFVYTWICAPCARRGQQAPWNELSTVVSSHVAAGDPTEVL